MIPEELNNIADRIAINDEGCWVWTGCATNSGYGRLQIDNIVWVAHRYVAWRIMGLEKIAKYIIRHKCGNTLCCNPDHLIMCERKDTLYDFLYPPNVHIRRRAHWIRKWIVGENTYIGLRNAIQQSGLSQHTLTKYTDKETRIFDIEGYREGCKRAGRKPRI